MCAGNVGMRGAVRMVATAEPTMSASWSKMDKMKSRYGGLIFQPDESLVGDDIGFSYDEMSAQMQEIISYTRGDTCTGTILGFEPNGALVDIGVKSSAYCALGEMALVKPSKCEDVFAIGDNVEFVITSREDENGQLMLSRRRILYQEAWDHVAQLYADDATCEAEVSAVNRGGAMVQVEGLRAFLPGSHFLAGQTPTEALVGSKLAVKFLDVDKEGNRLVVSHKKAIVADTIKELQVGAVVNGVVTAVKPYGAFVDVGGMSGLLHISQISCDHISNVEAVLPMGSAIKCMVISQDKAKGRVALSTKTLEAEPGDMIKAQEKVFEHAEETAAKYQERLEAERKAREEAAQDVIFGLESVFSDAPADADAPADDAPAPAPAGDLPLE
jgi:ribosomal protein S1